MANIYMKTSQTNAVMGWFNKHLTLVAERTLKNTPVLYEFADKHPLPGGSGKTLFVPRHISQDTIAALTEGTPVSICSNSAGYYSATVVGYGAARGYTDFLEMVREVPTTITHDIEDMMRDAGNKIDSLLRVQLCGVAFSATNYVAPDGATGYGSVASATNLKQRFLFDANTTLASNKAPRYSDGCYWGAFHPRQIHDLFINTSAGGTNLGIDNVNWLEGTETGVKAIQRAMIGKLGGIRIFETTNTPTIINGTSISGAASSSGFQAYVMGPGAIGAIDLSTAKLRSYVKALGSAGTADPIDQLMTVGVKFYFAPLKKDTNRFVYTASGKTL